MIEIDGSQGEGGGQILRSALALSMITGVSLRLYNIRARRPKPGLKPQHLKAVEAATAISGANVEGARLDSQTLIFQPHAVKPGSYVFDIGTAGATSLVLQTVFLPLSLAAESSELTIIGGTHVPWSPCYHYLEWHWLHYLKQAGYHAELSLQQPGFYPRGGGRIHAAIHPSPSRRPLNLTERGQLNCIRGLSAVANLDISIAERQRNRARQRLQQHCSEIEIAIASFPAYSRGTFLLLLAEFEKSGCCYYALGAPGKAAEAVADEAVAELEAFIATDGAIDEHLADQLILPLAFAPGISRLRTAKITRHLVTNATVIRYFLPVEIDIAGDIGGAGLISLRVPQ